MLISGGPRILITVCFVEIAKCDGNGCVHSGSNHPKFTFIFIDPDIYITKIRWESTQYTLENNHGPLGLLGQHWN